MIEIKITNNFNLHDTVTCGQIFRFTCEDDNSYTIVIKDRVINIIQNDNRLLVKSNNEENLERVVRKYFDLDRDYDEINNELISLNKEIEATVDKCKGLKMINQDYFETLIAYIISANNRVFMIANCLNNIAKEYGKKINFEGKDYYLFPDSKDLSKVTKEEFRNLKVGFRDEYIVDVVKKVNSGELNLESIADMSTEAAMNLLMRNKGIGEKVASCILLFAYFKTDVFPIDTWVKKYMLDNYNISGVKNIKEFAVKNYGKYCGIAIQYMFHARRNK